MLTALKFFDFLEKAIKAADTTAKSDGHTTKSSKTKSTTKKNADPFVSDDNEHDKVALSPDALCMQRALKGVHKVVRFEGQLAWVLWLVKAQFHSLFFLSIHHMSLVEK
jgi:hypothetical protein